MFESVEAYNAAHPASPFPTDRHARSVLRGYEADRVGTVVASRWGEGPVLVLATDVSLRAAWEAIKEAWPKHLSDVHTALESLPRTDTRST